MFIGHSFDKAGAYLSSSVTLFALPCIFAALLQLAIPAYPGERSETVLATEVLATSAETAL